MQTTKDRTVNQILGISSELAHEVLWQYGRHGRIGDHYYGIQPSGFKRRLFACISKADSENRRKLAFVYPAEVAACELIENHPEGVNTLQHLAEGIELRD